jgi:hypothetical protein
MTVDVAYYLYCRMSADHVKIGHFSGRELYQTIERPSVVFLAEKAVDKYFHQADGLTMKQDMQLMFKALLVMLPILSRIPGSLHPDQHCGHVLSWLRVYAGGNANRRFVSCREVPRVHNPALLKKRLEQLGIHDQRFIKVLVALFRAYYWRETVAGKLARVLFDPIMIEEAPAERHSLRIGNRVYTLHKEGCKKAIDMNKSPLILFDYLIRYDDSPEQRKVVITLSPEAVAKFKEDVRWIVGWNCSAKRRAAMLERCIDGFSNRAKWAKDGKTEVEALRSWLWRTLQPLETEGADVKHLPNVLMNLFLQKRVTELTRAKRNVFYTLHEVELRVFLNFLSPYREE